MIPYGRQDISQADIDAVVEVLKSDFLTQGPKVPEFEKAIASYCGAKYGVAVNSATSALHIANMALGLGAGDVMWTTPNTFLATANSALFCNADVDFVDIDPVTYNLCPKALEAKLQAAKASGERLPKVVIPVHLTGQSCDMKAIHALGQEYGFKIIEDASHAIGAKYDGKPVGGCQYSDITVFSFHPVKIITTAEGGLATTNDAELAQKMDLYRCHGMTRDESLMTHASEGGWYYQQIALGYNYRMTEMQAALGVSQMSKLDDFIARRNALAERYHALLEDLPLVLPHVNDDCLSSYHLYVIRLQGEARHSEVYHKLREGGIGVNLHYIPVHLQPYYKEKFGFGRGDFPNAEHYYDTAISIPLFATMTEEQQDTVVAKIKGCF